MTGDTYTRLVAAEQGAWQHLKAVEQFCAHLLQEANAHWEDQATAKRLFEEAYDHQRYMERKNVR